ncbi:anti-sigma-I factor RsgI family protein, partial [Anaerorhabdus sp.]
MKQLDHIEVSEEKKQQIFEQVLTKKSMKYFKPSLIITLVSVLILAVLVSFPSFRNAPIIQNNLIISAVAMESDASIILNLNDNDQVVSIETTGEEVKFIQNKTDLVGLNVQDAMAIILELEDYQKILNNENLEIIIYSDSDSKELNLGTQVNEVLTKHMRNESCNMQYVDKETFDKARQRNMGVGKYTRIENILKSDDTYT